MGDAIKYLYSQFLLRDVLSFITPGAIVVLSAILVLLPEPCISQRINTLFQYSNSIRWLLYIPLFGIFFLTGYAIQCLQCLFGYVRLHRLDKSRCDQRSDILHSGWQDKPDYVWKEAREKVMDFLNVTARADWARQHCERSVILKQMCANSFGAIIIAGIFLLTDAFCPYKYADVLTVSVVSILLLISMLWGYRNSELAVDTIERKVESLHDAGKLKEDK